VEVVILDVEFFQGCFGDFDALRITPPVNVTGDIEACFCLGGGNQLNNDLMADERSAAPVDADKGEHAVLYAVPFAGAGRMMGDGDGKTGFIGQLL
jgi:hypothetical protein